MATLLPYLVWSIFVAESVSALTSISSSQSNEVPCSTQVTQCLNTYRSGSSQTCSAVRDVITCVQTLECPPPEVFVYTSVLQTLVGDLAEAHDDCCEDRFNCLGETVDKWAGSESSNMTSQPEENVEMCQALVDFVNCQQAVKSCTPVNVTKLQSTVDQVFLQENSNATCVLPFLQPWLTTQKCYLAHKQCLSIQPGPLEDFDDEVYCQQVIDSAHCSVGLNCLSNITLRLIEVTTTQLLEELDKPCEVIDIFQDESAQMNECDEARSSCEIGYVDSIVQHDVEGEERDGDLCSDLNVLVACLRRNENCARDADDIDRVVSEEQLRLEITCRITRGSGPSTHAWSPFPLLTCLAVGLLLWGAPVFF